MKLLLFLSNELVGEVPICRESITLPGYLGKMKKELQFKYANRINRTNIEPEFLVVNLTEKNKKPDWQKSFCLENWSIILGFDTG